jgi:hypothetical protein
VRAARARGHTRAQVEGGVGRCVPAYLLLAGDTAKPINRPSVTAAFLPRPAQPRPAAPGGRKKDARFRLTRRGRWRAEADGADRRVAPPRRSLGYFQSKRGLSLSRPIAAYRDFPIFQNLITIRPKQRRQITKKLDWVIRCSIWE